MIRFRKRSIRVDEADILTAGFWSAYRDEATLMTEAWICLSRSRAERRVLQCVLARLRLLAMPAVAAAAPIAERLNSA